MNRTLRAWPHIPSKDEHSHVGEQDVMDEPDVEEIDEQDIVDEPEVEEIDEQDPDTPEEREKFYQEVCVRVLFLVVMCSVGHTYPLFFLNHTLLLI
jgi:hypothetical protein